MKYILLSFVLLISGFAKSSEYLYDYVFFENSLMDGFHFYTKTQYTSPSWVKNARNHLPVNGHAFTPGNSLELTYISASEGYWYSEIQYCPVRGNDFFRVPQVLSLRLFTEKEIKKAALPEIAIRYEDSTYTKQLKLADYLEEDEKQIWHTISIPLKDFGLNEINDSNIKTLAAVAFYPGIKDGNQHTLYIDDLELLPENLPVVSELKTPQLNEAKAYERHIDIAWTPQNNGQIKYYRIYRSTDGANYTPVAIRRPWLNRFTDFVGETGYKA